VRRVIATTGILLASALPGHARGEDVRVKVQLEARSEVDTNPHRTESSDDRFPPTTAASGSTVARLALAWRPSPSQSLRVRLVGSGRRYVGAQGSLSLENVAQLAADLGYDVAPSSHHVAGLRLSYYDAYQQGFDPALSRDFRTGDAALLLSLRRSAHEQATALVGYRLFRYKPDAELDFNAAELGLAYRRTFESPESPENEESPTTDLSVEYKLGHRQYGGMALALCPTDGPDILPIGCRTQEERTDLVHDVTLEWIHTAHRIYSARYDLFATDSTSQGQSQVRHRFALSATTELWAQLFVSATVVAQLSQSLSTVPARSIDDDAHSGLILHFTRDVWDDVSLEARYALYAYDVTASSLGYTRQTAYLGAVYTLRR
jgi:hypothetical protein